MWTDFNSLQDLQQLTVGTSAVSLPTPSAASGIKNPERIMLQALSTNGAVIFVGEADVLADGSTGGFEMPAGSSLILPLRVASAYKAISAAAGQKLQVSFLAG